MIASVRHLKTLITPYIELMRLEKPAGFLLLMWPCWWGVALAQNINDSQLNYFLFSAKSWVFLFLFTIGAIIVRGAGCVVNDIADRKIDALVERTKNRPLASGRLNLRQAILFLALLLTIGLAVFLQLNLTAQILAMSAFVIAVIYPFTKRFFVLPQLVLGLCFNSGVLVGYAAITGQISTAAILLYLGGICWTLAYDTIYANQDKLDDVKAGINSSALLFGQKNKFFIGLFFALTWLLLAQTISFTPLSYVALAALALDFGWQMHKLDLSNPQNCIKLFKHNAFISGGLALLSLLII